MKAQKSEKDEADTIFTRILPRSSSDDTLIINWNLKQVLRVISVMNPLQRI